MFQTPVSDCQQEQRRRQEQEEQIDIDRPSPRPMTAESSVKCKQRITTHSMYWGGLGIYGSPMECLDRKRMPSVECCRTTRLTIRRKDTKSRIKWKRERGTNVTNVTHEKEIKASTPSLMIRLNEPKPWTTCTNSAQTLQTALGPSKPRGLRPQTPPYEGPTLHMRAHERLGGTFYKPNTITTPLNSPPKLPPTSSCHVPCHRCEEKTDSYLVAKYAVSYNKHFHQPAPLHH